MRISFILPFSHSSSCACIFRRKTNYINITRKKTSLTSVENTRMALPHSLAVETVDPHRKKRAKSRHSASLECIKTERQMPLLLSMLSQSHSLSRTAIKARVCAATISKIVMSKQFDAPRLAPLKSLRADKYAKKLSKFCQTFARVNNIRNLLVLLLCYHHSQKKFQSRFLNLTKKKLHLMNNLKKCMRISKLFRDSCLFI